MPTFLHLFSTTDKGKTDSQEDICHLHVPSEAILKFDVILPENNNNNNNKTTTQKQNCANCPVVYLQQMSKSNFIIPHEVCFS